MTGRTNPFGCRTSLAPGAPTFVGRRRVEWIRGYVGGQYDTNSVAVVGPRRSGRSSLLQQLSHAPVLAGSVLEGAVVVQADFRNFRGRPEDAVRHLIQRLTATIGGPPYHCDGRGIAESRTFAEAVRRALTLFDARLIVAMDDFDYLGSDLRKDHQADLRQAVYHEPRAGYVIASRMRLARCLEEFGDNLSDLAPIATPMFLEPLSGMDVQEMVMRNLGVDSETAVALAQVAYRRVGGFPQWTQLALSIEFVENQSPGRSAPSAAAIERRTFEVLEDDWARAYQALSPPARRALEEPGNECNEQVWDELLAGGWTSPDERERFVPAGTLVERWLERRARDPVVITLRSNEGDSYDHLLQAVYQINTKYQRHARQRNGRVFRPDVFHSPQDNPYLRRRARNDEDFARFVLAMARLLYDGTNGATEHAKTLPTFCYEDPRCVVRQVMTLRNAFVHIVHPDQGTADRNLHAEVAVYEHYIGVKSPNSAAHFRQLAEALMAAAISFIERATPVCPFSSELSPEALLGGDSRATG